MELKLESLYETEYLNSVKNEDQDSENLLESACYDDSCESCQCHCNLHIE